MGQAVKTQGHLHHMCQATQICPIRRATLLVFPATVTFTTKIEI